VDLVDELDELELLPPLLLLLLLLLPPHAATPNAIALSAPAVASARRDIGVRITCSSS
jgi:hypothetical protein